MMTAWIHVVYCSQTKSFASLLFIETDLLDMPYVHKHQEERYNDENTKICMFIHSISMLIKISMFIHSICMLINFPL